MHPGPHMIIQAKQIAYLATSKGPIRVGLQIGSHFRSASIGHGKPRRLFVGSRILGKKRSENRPRFG